jgi:hypothetical protein
MEYMFIEMQLFREIHIPLPLRGLCTKTPFSSDVIPAKAGIHLLPFAVSASISRILFTEAVGDGSRLSPG